MPGWYSKDSKLAERNRATVILLDQENERRTIDVKVNEKTSGREQRSRP
jgi:hypothetical protein